MTPEADTDMRAFIDDNPKGKHGEHHDTPEEYGLIPEVVRHDFRDYVDRFDLASK